MIRFIRLLIKKHNERVLLKKGFIRCAHCKQLILKQDRYCQYCGHIIQKELSSKFH